MLTHLIVITILVLCDLILLSETRFFEKNVGWIELEVMGKHLGMGNESACAMPGRDDSGNGSLLVGQVLCFI